eukprot:1128259-Rhodomonas_salina.1
MPRCSGMVLGLVGVVYCGAALRECIADYTYCEMEGHAQEWRSPALRGMREHDSFRIPKTLVSSS